MSLTPIVISTDDKGNYYTVLRYEELGTLPKPNFITLKPILIMGTKKALTHNITKSRNHHLDVGETQLLYNNIGQ